MTQTSNTMIAPILGVGSTLILGSTMWVLQPEKAIFWVIAMSFLPVAWLISELRARGQAGTLGTLRYAITGASMMIALPLLAGLAKQTGALEFLSEDMQSRMDGLALGLFLLIYGNFMPKRAVPLDETEASPGTQQSLNLHTGLILMVMGLATILITGFAPADYYNPITLVALGIGSFAIIRRAVVAKKQG
jgi:hypothetical protein